MFALGVQLLVGCSGPAARCEAVAPGTPLSALGTLTTFPTTCGAPTSNPDVALVQCCMAHPGTDGGCGTDCTALAPYGSTGLSGDYTGGECGDGARAGWSCGVWYRNGQVILATACCSD